MLDVLIFLHSRRRSPWISFDKSLHLAEAVLGTGTSLPEWRVLGLRWSLGVVLEEGSFLGVAEVSLLSVDEAGGVNGLAVVFDP